MVQASAGTGKSFLLSSVYLFCIVHGFRCKAAAPTGIAAANIEIPRTDVRATTLHALFEERVFIACLSQLSQGETLVEKTKSADPQEALHTTHCATETPIRKRIGKTSSLV